MRIRALLPIVAAGALAAGCGAEAAPTPGGVVGAPVGRVQSAVPAGDAAALRAGNAEFAGRLLALLARTHATVALSPASISEALAMTFAGARGATATQLAHALDFRLPPARLAAAYNALEVSLAKVNGPAVTLHVANALYGQAGESFRRAFLGLLAREYGAGLRTVDFAHQPDAALAAINAWVSAQTAGKIPQLLDAGDIQPLTKLVLVNAVYLDAKWLEPFEPQNTSLAPFHAPSGTVQVRTMHQSASFPYLAAAGYQAVELPYRGGRLACDILLPGPGQLRSLLARLAALGPLQLLHGLRATELGLALPKLQLTTRFELAGALGRLGMPLAFEPGGADLSGIAGEPGDLYISAVVHEAYLRVDEEGTQAAAATGVGVTGTAVMAPPPVQVVVNRPFVFVLRDVKTGAVLFTGVVSRP
jgi:serpin B